jgi:serine/threonine-protein phosphatase 2A regulatory subunit A
MLERLAAIEETVVRDQGVTVLTAVCDMVIRQKGEKTVDVAAWVGLAKRLAAADWFTAKVSACGVLAPMFSLTGDEDLLHTYKELTTDETPMVRRAAAKYLGKVLHAAGWQHKDLVVAALPALIRDEQDSVRLLAVAALAEAGPSYGEHCQWTIQNWLPLLKDGCTDMSWYV